MQLLDKIFSIKTGGRHNIVSFFGIKFKIKNKSDTAVHDKILKSKYKYVHVMNNGIHSVDIIRFINKHLNKKKEHCFVFPIVFFDKTKEALGKEPHVFRCDLPLLKSKSIDKYIVHGLFDDKLAMVLYTNPDILVKSYWFIWGGDLYSYKDTPVNNYVRRHVAGVITPFDIEVYYEKFGRSKPHYDIHYDNTLIDYNALPAKKNSYTHIMLNNCADTNTLQLLQTLAKYKDENVKISTILSYTAAGQEDNKDNIIELGKSIFKDKFNPVFDFLPPKEYAAFLDTVDIYISNQDRQQGQGNASYLLMQGKKVYIKGTTSVFKWYQKLGIKYYDSDLIADYSFAELCHQDAKQVKTTVNNMKKRLNIRSLLKRWRKFLHDKK